MYNIQVSAFLSHLCVVALLCGLALTSLTERTKVYVCIDKGSVMNSANMHHQLLPAAPLKALHRGTVGKRSNSIRSCDSRPGSPSQQLNSIYGPQRSCTPTSVSMLHSVMTEISVFIYKTPLISHLAVNSNSCTQSCTDASFNLMA